MNYNKFRSIMAIAKGLVLDGYPEDVKEFFLDNGVNVTDFMVEDFIMRTSK